MSVSLAKWVYAHNIQTCRSLGLCCSTMLATGERGALKSGIESLLSRGDTRLSLANFSTYQQRNTSRRH